MKQITDTHCSHSTCKGVCFNVTTVLASVLGVQHYKCDTCGAVYIFKVKGK